MCTVEAVQAYFNNNTLPTFGQVCEVDEALFPSKGDSLQQGVSDWQDHVILVSEALLQAHPSY
jgi:hypothetical protein